MPSAHEIIDARLYELVAASIRKIDADPSLGRHLRANVGRWPNERLRAQWSELLDLPWAGLKSRLLARSEGGAALRQDAPLAGVLSPAERLAIMRKYSLSRDARAA